MGTLAACGASSGGGVTNDGGGSSSSSTNDGGGGSSSGSITGTITWPDGNPAANASVYFYNYDPGFSGAGAVPYQAAAWYGWLNACSEFRDHHGDSAVHVTGLRAAARNPTSPAG